MRASLPQSLSRVEAWGFAYTGLFLWVFMAPGAESALGWWSLPMWAVVTAVGMFTNRQIRRLGETWPDMSGGTPNYAVRLLAPRSPGLARYAAMAYFQGWASVPSLSALLLAQLVGERLGRVGLAEPVLLLTVLFAAGPFLIAFAGTRVLSVLHLVFLLPALGSMLVFILTGLAMQPDVQPAITAPDAVVPELAKWFFVATYCAYSVETASAFLADCRRPRAALDGLRAATWSMPLVLVGGSYVLIRFAGTNDAEGQDVLTSTVALLFGSAGSAVTTILLTTATLLSITTAAADSPRVVFQLARDGMAAPLFARLTRRGVPGPALVLTLLVSLVYLLVGDALTALAITSTGWFFSFLCLQLAMWLDRDQPHIGLRTGWTALAILVVEVPVFLVGGLAWGFGAFAVGLAAPAALLALDAALARLPAAATHLPARRRTRAAAEPGDGIIAQILILIAGGTIGGGWLLGRQATGNTAASIDALIVLMLLAVFAAVALAAWTSLDQAGRVLESRELARAEANHLLRSARDGVLVADGDGRVTASNPAAHGLLGEGELLGRPAARLLAFAAAAPAQWPERSSHTVRQRTGRERSVEVTVSRVDLGQHVEYVLVLRDVTEQRELQHQLTRQALHDSLTGLPNPGAALCCAGHLHQRRCCRAGAVRPAVRRPGRVQAGQRRLGARGRGPGAGHRRRTARCLPTAWRRRRPAGWGRIRTPAAGRH